MIYTVKPGDTLSEIAQKYGTTVEALVASNGIHNKNVIFVGQSLEIPTKQTNLSGNQIYNAFISCLDAIEALPEFKQLEALLHG